MYQRATLNNGLEIIGELVPHVNSISIGLWLDTGSRDEPHGQEGMAHLIEHMLFKGTKRRSARELAEAIDAVGGQLNAFTTREYTCFYARVLGSHLELGLSLLAEMYSESAFELDEFAKEKGVIMEEIKSYNDAPDELVHDLLAEVVWPGHALGHPILGTPNSLAAMTRDDALRFMQSQYRADRTVLAVAGRFDFARLIEAAQTHLGGILPGGTHRHAPAPPAAIGRIIKNKETEQVHLCLGAQGVERRSPDKFALLVLDSIFGGCVSSRLFQKLREDRGLVYAICSAHSAYRDTGLLSVYAGTAPDRAAEVIGLILEELRRLAEEPITASEMARAKEQLRGNFLLSMEGMNTRMSHLAKSLLFYDDILTPEQILARVDDVSAEDLARLAQRTLRSGLAAAAIAPSGINLDLDRLLGEVSA